MPVVAGSRRSRSGTVVVSALADRACCTFRIALRACASCTAARVMKRWRSAGCRACSEHALRATAYLRWSNSRSSIVRPACAVNLPPGCAQAVKIWSAGGKTPVSERGGPTGVDPDALTVQGRCERRRPASDPSRTAKRGGAAQAAVVAAARGFAVGGRTWRPRARGYSRRSLPSFAHWQPYSGVGRPFAPPGETSASSGARRSSLNHKTISFSIQVQFHCPSKAYKFKKSLTIII
jgi:hypothetical protein